MLDPLRDMAVLEASLSWGEHVEQAEQVAAACAIAPAAVPPVSFASSWVAFQPRAGSADHCPVLQDLDVIAAV